MKIKSIASGSSGNAYVIDSKGFKLLIECGVPYKQIKKALDYDVDKVLGCLISHNHNDHSGFAYQINLESCIRIYCTTETAKKKDLLSTVELQHQKFYQIEDKFSLYPLELSHFNTDGTRVETYGFLIYSYLENKSLFYLSDTGKACAPIANLSYLMIEANHSMSALVNSGLKPSVVNRIAKSHLDIDQVCNFVKKHRTLEQIWLLHMSDGHGDEAEFKRRVQEVSGVPVVVC